MPETGRFNPGIVCAECQDRPCWCCEVCGVALGICEHGDARLVEINTDADVIAAVRVLAAHGIDGTKYEALQALAAGNRNG